MNQAILDKINTTLRENPTESTGCMITYEVGKGKGVSVQETPLICDCCHRQVMNPRIEGTDIVIPSGAEEDSSLRIPLRAVVFMAITVEDAEGIEDQYYRLQVYRSGSGNLITHEDMWYGEEDGNEEYDIYDIYPHLEDDLPSLN